MRSDVCKIENGTRDLEAILKESERVAEYNGLTHKQALQLRLLCEEIDGMLPNVIDDFDGELWIEYEQGVCKINVSIKIPEITTSKKEELIAISKNKKNAAAVGIVGKIRDVLENMFYDEDAMAALSMSSGAAPMYCGVLDYAHLWTLGAYRSTVDQEEDFEQWDELEKSVIASVADDVIVGVKGKKADIIIIKKFA